MLTRGRLGIYSDDVLRLRSTPAGVRVGTDQAFLLFAVAVGERFDRVVLLGRGVPAEAAADIELPAGVAVAELPSYERLGDLKAVVRVLPGTLAALWRGLGGVDLVWVFGPNPYGVALIVLALLRRRRVALGVRQDTLAYFRSRLPSRRRRTWLAPLWIMDRVYRRLSRRLPTTVVGNALAEGYGKRALAMTVTLVRDADVAVAVPRRDWGVPIELLAVGRVDAEKNPLLLIDALAELERTEPGRHRVRWVGRGPLEGAVRRRANELGVDHLLALSGFVPFGRALLDVYRAAHVVVLASLTEGVPQVLIEAMACGTPIVATDVGGVRAALDGGRAGLLVPPGDRAALVAAVRRIERDAALRDGMVARGLQLARATTLDAEADRVARFLGEG